MEEGRMYNSKKKDDFGTFASPPNWSDRPNSDETPNSLYFLLIDNVLFVFDIFYL